MFFFFNFKHFGSGASASAGSAGDSGGEVARTVVKWVKKPKKPRDDSEYRKLSLKPEQVAEVTIEAPPPVVKAAIKYIKQAPKPPSEPPRLVAFNYTPLLGYEKQPLVEPILQAKEESSQKAESKDLLSYSYEDVEAWVRYLAEKKAREEQEILELVAAIKEQESAEKARIDAIIAEFERLKKEEEDNLEWAVLAMAAGKPKLASLIIGLHD